MKTVSVRIGTSRLAGVVIPGADLHQICAPKDFGSPHFWEAKFWWLVTRRQPPHIEGLTRRVAVASFWAMQEKQNPYEPTPQELVEDEYSIWTRPLTFRSCLGWLFLSPIVFLLALFVLLVVNCSGIYSTIGNWWLSPTKVHLCLLSIRRGSDSTVSRATVTSRRPGHSPLTVVKYYSQSSPATLERAMMLGASATDWETSQRYWR